MTSRSPCARAVILAAITLLAATPLRAEVGSGARMTGRFGPRSATTVVQAGPAVDDFKVTLKRSAGQCSGELSGTGRALLPYLVTLSRLDPDTRTTCTVDLIYAPDFTSIEVKESAACLTWHGASCDFQGTFKRSRP